MAERESDDDRLTAIAHRIADGADVDWADQIETTDSDLASRLRIIEKIFRANRAIVLEAPLYVPPAEPPIGSKWGHLTVLEKIAEGSFGGVYHARDDRLQADVALKLLRPRGRDDAEYADHLLTEARLLARVRHPNVVRVYGADDEQVPVGLWMELVKGRTLADLLEHQGPFGAHEAAIIGVDLCRALAAVHHEGLVHGDVKARNVMREDGGRVVLMDFGAGDALASPTSNITATPVYAAPELLAHRERSVRTDIYSLGVLLYHLVTGEYPVRGDTATEIIDAHRREQRHLLDIRPDLPTTFVRIVERALATSPRERYASAGALDADLSRFVGSGPGRHSWLWPLTIAATLTIAISWLALTVIGRSRSSAIGGSAAIGSAASTIPAALQPAAYSVDARFLKVTDIGEQPLKNNDHIQLGDRLALTYESTRPTYLYVVNEPEQGQSFLLFPLRGAALENPIPANERKRFPDGFSWQVTNPGGREHFIVIAGPEPLTAFEETFARMRTPRVGEPVTANPLPAVAVERLRGVGGLVQTAPPANDGRLSSLFTTPLAGRETVVGVWARQLTLENPQSPR